MSRFIPVQCMGRLRRIPRTLLFILSIVYLDSRGADPAEAVAAAPAPRVADEPKTIQQYGLTFVLASSSRADAVQTEEYLLQGESATSWSQMLTYQRVLLPAPVGADEYVTLLKTHLEQRSAPPRVRVVQQGKSASVFGIHYPATDGVPEQVSLALCTVADPKRPNELHVVQFSVNPARLSLEEMELQVKRWQGRFQSQAASLSR